MKEINFRDILKEDVNFYKGLCFSFQEIWKISPVFDKAWRIVFKDSSVENVKKYIQKNGAVRVCYQNRKSLLNEYCNNNLCEQIAKLCSNIVEQRKERINVNSVNRNDLAMYVVRKAGLGLKRINYYPKKEDLPEDGIFWIWEFSFKINKKKLNDKIIRFGHKKCASKVFLVKNYKNFEKYKDSYGVWARLIKDEEKHGVFELLPQEMFKDYSFSFRDENDRQKKIKEEELNFDL